MGGMSIDKKSFVLMVGFLVGIFVWEDVSWGLFFGLMGAGTCFYLWKRRGVFGEMLFLGLCFVFLGIFFGMGRGFLADRVGDDDVRHLNGRGEIVFDACVSNEVDVRFDRVKYTVTDVCVLAGAEGAGQSCEKFDGKILINAEKYPVYEYGDILRVRGEASAPEPIEDFAYDKYLARHGIYSVVNGGRASKVESESALGRDSRSDYGCGNFFYKWIFKFKGAFERKLGELFSEPHGSLVAGLLLGVRKGIPEEVTKDFNETGLTHIVAISGYNITLVIIVVFGMFGFLSRKGRVIAASGFVVVFVILVGASSAVVRAGIMGVLGLFAVYFGRRNEVAIAIIVSAFLMNLVNPKIAVYDTGFQLSFLATLGLVYVSPKIEVVGGVFGRALARVPVAFAVRENLIMTLSAQAFALPVILKSFGRFSLICPLANIFVLPFIPFVMLASFFAVTFGFLWGGLGEIFAFVCYFVLDVVFFLIGVFADLSRAL